MKVTFSQWKTEDGVTRIYGYMNLGGREITLAINAKDEKDEETCRELIRFIGNKAEE